MHARNASKSVFRQLTAPLDNGAGVLTQTTVVQSNSAFTTIQYSPVNGLDVEPVKSMHAHSALKHVGGLGSALVVKIALL
jgi:hypothetical protein